MGYHLNIAKNNQKTIKQLTEMLLNQHLSLKQQVNLLDRIDGLASESLQRIDIEESIKVAHGS